MLHLTGGLEMDMCSKRWVCNCCNAHFIDFYCFFSASRSALAEIIHEIFHFLSVWGRMQRSIHSGGYFSQTTSTRCNSCRCDARLINGQISRRMTSELMTRTWLCGLRSFSISFPSCTHKALDGGGVFISDTIREFTRSFFSLYCFQGDFYWVFLSPCCSLGA